MLKNNKILFILYNLNVDYNKIWNISANQNLHKLWCNIETQWSQLTSFYLLSFGS